MISVPSRRLLLSGSKMMYLLICLQLLYGCSTSRRNTVSNAQGENVQIVKADKSNRKDTIPTKVPGIPLKTKIDTVKWIIDESFQPITSGKGKDKSVSDTGFKSFYNIGLYIPLNSDGTSVEQASASGYMHFYAGLLTALDELGSDGMKFKLFVTDTEEGKFDAAKAFEKALQNEIDLIIGPFERDDVKYMAEQGKEHRIAVISPWQTSTKITTGNPWYIQLKPNLKAHFFKITEHICSRFQRQEVAVIGRNNADFNAWYNYFESSARQILNKPDQSYFEKFYTNNDSLSTGPTAFSRLFQNSKIKAVILPNYSFNDELYVYNVVRKLAVEKGNKNIILYGMPMLYDTDRLEYEHYHSLNMRLVISDFVDETESAVREFRKKYFDIFGEIALPDAVKGYDIMMFAGKQLFQNGKNIQTGLENPGQNFLQNNFEIIKARSEDASGNNLPESFDYYENNSLSIIEFSNSRFKRIY
jgi:ABC-type branched-subunit amino acid transport system substrate-binding protein